LTAWHRRNHRVGPAPSAPNPVALGVGAWAAGPMTVVEDAEQVSRRRGAVLPALTFVALAGFQVASIAGDALTGDEVALSLGVSVVGATLIARATVLRREQSVLYARLRERERELRDATAAWARNRAATRSPD
jgi:hypothetical protein